MRDYAVQPLLICAVATVPPRFHLVNMTITGIARQTLQPDRMVVIVAKQYVRFPMNTSSLERLRTLVVAAGADMYLRDEDLGPVTKVIGALEYMRENLAPAMLAVSTLITIDEDIVYPVWCFEHMVHWAHVLPISAIANAGGEYNGPTGPPRYIGSASRPWLASAHCKKFCGVQPSPPCTAVSANYVYGWAAVLYRSEFFDERLWSNIGWLANESSHADDQYVSGHLGLRAVPITIIPPLRVANWWPASFAHTKYAHTMRQEQLRSNPDDQWRPLDASITSAARPEESLKGTNKRHLLQRKLAIIDGVLGHFGGADFWVANASYVRHASWCKGASATEKSYRAGDTPTITLPL